MQGFNAVTVVVRSMDRPQLGRALRSVAVQVADVESEVLVVAACGPGHSPVPSRLGRATCRLVASSGRLDRPRAANAGIDAARGDWLTFLDDDDELLPHHFSTLLGAVGDAPDRAVIHARSIATASDGRALHLYGGPFVPWRQLEQGFTQMGATLFSRTLFDRGVRFDEALPVLEDLDILVQCARLTAFHFVEAPVLRYYIEDGTSGTGDGPNRDWARTREPLAYIRRKWAALARELEEMPEARLERGQALAKAGRFQETWLTLAPLLRRGIRDVNVLNLCAMALLYLGNLDEARPLLEQALEMLPQHPGLLANLAILRRFERDGTPPDA